MTDLLEPNQLNLVIEGPDGSGKSTLVKKLVDHFSFLATKHPGETDLGKEIRKIVKNREDIAVGKYTEQVLLTADLCDFIEQILIPHINKGGTVISDRSNFISGLIYSLAGDVDKEQIRRFQDVALALNPPRMHLIVLHSTYDELVERQHHDVIDGNETRCKIQDRGKKYHIKVCNNYNKLIACRNLLEVSGNTHIINYGDQELGQYASTVAQYVALYHGQLSIWPISALLPEDEVFASAKKIVEMLLYSSS